MVSWLLTGTDPRSAKFPCRSTVNFDDEEDYDPEKDKCVKTIAIAPKPENDEMCGFSMAVLDSKIYCQLCWRLNCDFTLLIKINLHIPLNFISKFNFPTLHNK